MKEKEPFVIVWPPNLLGHVQKTTQLPEGFKPVIRYAQRESVIAPGLALFRQVYSGSQFYLEHLTIQTVAETVLEIRVKRPCAIYINVESGAVNGIPSGRYGVQFFPAGNFPLPLSAGENRFQYFVLDQGFMLDYIEDFSEMSEAIAGLTEAGTEPTLFPVFYSSRRTQAQLEKLTTCHRKQTFLLEISLTSTMHKMLKDYNVQLWQRQCMDHSFPDEVPANLIKYIQDQVDRSIMPEVQEITAHFCMGSKTLCRISERHFGMPTQKLILSVQMETAEILLRSGLSVSEVAQKIGYAATSTFSSRFKEHFGHSPSTVLKQMGQI